MINEIRVKLTFMWENNENLTTTSWVGRIFPTIEKVIIINTHTHRRLCPHHKCDPFQSDLDKMSKVKTPNIIA